MGFCEGRSGQAGGYYAGEVWAVVEVFVRARQGVRDSGARRLRLGNPLVQFGELALVQLPPIAAVR